MHYRFRTAWRFIEFAHFNIMALGGPMHIMFPPTASTQASRRDMIDKSVPIRLQM